MEIRRSEELAGLVRGLYAAMGSGDADAVEAFYSLSGQAVFLGTDRAEFWTDSARTTGTCGRTGSAPATS
jgi:hypothetical protein